ncbi:helix-turn-helix domain-containing protein [uncultured Brevundimonas sp.]|uniref:helix-turn-helix domain-containing protein n=1 Tax=uncultured Brevundimonas sp. TaxID=213418 RepID=UPI002600CE95|nr:helix-turn-helix domain-containing protein [uncultured Brevundimonas sp.]
MEAYRGFESHPVRHPRRRRRLGLSIVHVNRTLQQMRREKLIELQNGRLRVLDPVAMAQLCDFREPQPQTWLPAAAA